MIITICAGVFGDHDVPARLVAGVAWEFDCLYCKPDTLFRPATTRSKCIACKGTGKGLVAA